MSGNYEGASIKELGRNQLRSPAGGGGNRLEVILNEADVIYKRLMNLGDRLDILMNRTIGPIPSNPSTPTPSAPESPVITERLTSVVNRISGVCNSLDTIIGNLENL